MEYGLYYAQAQKCNLLNAYCTQTSSRCALRIHQKKHLKMLFLLFLLLLFSPRCLISFPSPASILWHCGLESRSRAGRSAKWSAELEASLFPSSPPPPSWPRGVNQEKKRRREGEEESKIAVVSLSPYLPLSAAQFSFSPQERILPVLY